MDEMIKVQTFDDIKTWLNLMIGIPTPSGLEEGAIKENKEMNVLARFWFRFISSNLMLSQNRSVYDLTKAAQWRVSWIVKG